MQIRRVLTIALALCVGVTLSAQNAQKDEKKRNKQEQQDIETLVALVDSASSGQPIGVDLPAKVTLTSTKETVVSVGESSIGDVPLEWEGAHFVRGQDGKTYVPFTLKVDPQRLSNRTVAMFVRAIDKAKAATPTATSGEKQDEKSAKTEYAWENVHFIDVPEDGRIARAMALPGGDYEVFVALKEKGTGDKKQVAKAGLMRKDFSVPNLAGSDLTTSSIIVAESVEPVATATTPEDQQDNPYTFGTLRIVPSRDGKLKKEGELQVLFWIYGTTQDASKKPDVEVEYSFHQKTAEGEKYFNKTAPQQLNATTLPPTFDMAAGHQLAGNIAVPLASFPAGEYRLEIKIKDKPSGKTLTRDVLFSVVG